MRNLRKTKKWICFVSVLFLCFVATCIIASSYEGTVTMTEFANSSVARKKAQSGMVVTISNLEEFRLFQEYQDKASNEWEKELKGLYGLKFRQEADITAGDYHYSYDEDIDKFVVWHGDKRMATIDREGVVFDKDGQKQETIESLGLSELMLWEWTGSRYFCGTYDGQGHSISGFLLGEIDWQGTDEGGIFCNLHFGTLMNVRVSDCCAVGCTSPLVNRVWCSTVSNCKVENSVGAAESFGGISGYLWKGTVQDCIVENSSFSLDANASDKTYLAGLGGVVGMIDGYGASNILGCRVMDTDLYGADFDCIGVGGVAGISIAREGYYADIPEEHYSPPPYEADEDGKDIVIQDCYASTAIRGGEYAGGILGRLGQNSTGSYEDTQIQNCVSEGSIVDPLGCANNGLGGILGCVGQDVSIVQLENCLSSSSISCRTQEGSSFGGIVGCTSSKTEIDSAIFCGSIESSEEERNRGFNSSSGGIIGDILGYKRAVTVVNCANFGNIIMMDDSQNNCGGLVGQVFGTEITIGNSLNKGRVCGHHVGGLAGTVASSEETASITMHNLLSLGMVDGNTEQAQKGALVSDMQKGDISNCFYLDALGQAFCFITPGFRNCCPVTEAQLAGTEEALPIFETGDVCSVRDVLTSTANLPDYRKKYSMWEDTEAGYPLPIGLEEILPIVLPKIGIEELEFKPQATKLPVSPRPIPSMCLPYATATPVVSRTETPVNVSTPTPSPVIPEKTPGRAETGRPSYSAAPTSAITTTPISSSTPIPSAKQSPYVKSPTPTEASVSVSGFKGNTSGNRCVVLSWKKQPKAMEYCIYRSTKKSVGFRQIKKCSAAKTKYKDKKCKPGKRYYYRIRPIYSKDGKRCQGKDSVLRITLPWLKTPTFRLSKGKNSYGEKYMQITLKRYAGKYVDVYLKKQNGRYIKAPMASHKIAAYQKKIRFTYKKSGAVYRCKIKTYMIKGGKKRYSGFSRVRKIRL